MADKMRKILMQAYAILILSVGSLASLLVALAWEIYKLARVDLVSGTLSEKGMVVVFSGIFLLYVVIFVSITKDSLSTVNDIRNKEKRRNEANRRFKKCV